MSGKILLPVILIQLLSLTCVAQDTTKLLYHEAGINIGSLLQQTRIFTVSPGQLPYDIFYNIYYKDIIGIRTGFGVLTEETNTQIEGQNTPRNTQFRKFNIRGGASYNVVLTRRLAVNVFFDGFLLKNELTSSVTTTVQVFPFPVYTRTVTSTDKISGGGVQGGVGLRLNLHRHVAIYTELPIIYTSESHLIEDSIRETGSPELKSRSVTNSSGLRIAVPVTLYLVLRL